MSGTKINQKEYLKKYLSNDKDSTDKKKKKKKSKDHAVSKKSNVIIIDDDIDLSHMQQISDKDLEVYAIGEDAPQIVGVFDERPAELIAREDYKQSEKWKVLAAVDGSLTINNFDKAGKMKSSSSHGPREPDKKFRKYESDEDDMSPVRARRNKSESSDASPVRRNQTAADPSRSSRFERRDVSPERRNAGGSSKDQRRRPSRSLSPKERHTSSRRKPSPARHLPREGTDKNTRRWSDASPSRKVKENSSRKRNKDSPEKRRQQRDVSLKRRQSPDDSSPPRKRDRNVSPKRQRDPEASQSKRVKTPPSRRRRDSDAAPPRRRRDSDASPPRRRRDSDASPPRRRRDSDASPPRKTSMSSPPRINRKDWDGKRPHSVDTSPPRRPAIKRERSPDASPPRRHHRDRSPSRNIKPSVEILNSKKLSRWSRDRSQCPPPEVSSAKMSKTLDGKAAGLQDAQAVRQENDSMRKREKEIFDRMSEEMSGRNAEAVVRDRKRGGMVRDVDAEMEVELEKMRKEQERKAVYDRWGKGVKQVEDYKTRKQEEDHEFSKPVARYADDSDLDALLRSKERDGDPMLEYLRSKQSTKESGKPAKPIYRGAFPENRFSIRPGYRWDGVDRSSGFEKRWFDVQSKKKAGEEEEYKYMTEDM